MSVMRSGFAMCIWIGLCVLPSSAQDEALGDQMLWDAYSALGESSGLCAMAHCTATRIPANGAPRTSTNTVFRVSIGRSEAKDWTDYSRVVGLQTVHTPARAFFGDVTYSPDNLLSKEVMLETISCRTGNEWINGMVFENGQKSFSRIKDEELRFDDKPVTEIGRAKLISEMMRNHQRHSHDFLFYPLLTIFDYSRKDIGHAGFKKNHINNKCIELKTEGDAFRARFLEGNLGYVKDYLFSPDHNFLPIENSLTFDSSKGDAKKLGIDFVDTPQCHTKVEWCEVKDGKENVRYLPRKIEFFQHPQKVGGNSKALEFKIVWRTDVAEEVLSIKNIMEETESNSLKELYVEMQAELERMLAAEQKPQRANRTKE